MARRSAARGLSLPNKGPRVAEGARHRDGGGRGTWTGCQRRSRPMAGLAARLSACAGQRVNSASSSNAAAQVLPQKRRTLSSGFSQYQHDPLAGRLSRDGSGRRAPSTGGSTAIPLSGKLSCIVSKVHPLPGNTSSDKARLLQWNNAGMRKLKRRGRTTCARTAVVADSVCTQADAAAMLSLSTVSR